MVAGGGIAGMQAALDCAEAGLKVYLVERRPSIGGRLAQLDKTFPTNDCATCMVAPRLVDCGRHLNIEVITLAEVLGVEGEAGDFRVRVQELPRYVDTERCIACGKCAEVCPRPTEDEFNQAQGKRKAAYIMFPQAVPLKYAIDPERCVRLSKGKGCGLCQSSCPAGAIDFTQTARERELSVGALILAPGFDTYDARRKGEYGYGRYPNVLTSLDLERLLAASGPTGGHLRRPSDGTEPKRVAWLQCVGSRDAAAGLPYCSSVCCMYATKQAGLAAEHVPGLSTSIFCLDVRAQGKGFERYYEAAKGRGVRYVRSLVSRVAEVPGSRNLRLSAFDEATGEVREEEFDLVVLSVGLRPSAEAGRLAEVCGITRNEWGFAASPALDSVATSRPGVFACGVFQGPKDVPETVMQASAAAARAQTLLAEARGSEVRAKVYPPERDVAGEEPRIGVFVCHCGSNIAGVVDVKAVAEYAAGLPFVRLAQNLLFTCSTDSQERLKGLIASERLNRVVVASCSPRTHESLFQESLRAAGLNRYLFEMANIRDQCSWVHAKESEAATEKAKALVRGAVARAALLEPLRELPFRPDHAALVVGGGVSGMTAALTLADQGFEAVLVEREAELGGHARELFFSQEGQALPPVLSALVRRVEEHPRVRVLTGAEVVTHGGSVGNFTTTLLRQGREKVIRHGVAIVATGGVEYLPTEHLCGEHEGVVTQHRLQHLLAREPQLAAGLRQVVMIQCVGSRNGEHPYCSRTCCQEAVQNALALKALNPTAQVFVLYRDMRTYGLSETRYRMAREQGVVFLRFEADRMPEVSAPEGHLQVSLREPGLGETVILTPDLLVLSAGVRPHPGAEALARAMRLPRDADGFFLEAHAKLRPLDFATAGVFVCGLAHGPKTIGESITQAQGAAGRAAGVLAKDEMLVGGAVAQVDAGRCVACLTCLRTCPFGVPRLDDERGVVMIDPAACQGCGNCAAACPRGAITVGHYSDLQMEAKVAAVSQA
jgi:heterodisulfide reductase subunit A